MDSPSDLADVWTISLVWPSAGIHVLDEKYRSSSKPTVLSRIPPPETTYSLAKAYDERSILQIQRMPTNTQPNSPTRTRKMDCKKMGHYDCY